MEHADRRITLGRAATNLVRIRPICERWFSGFSLCGRKSPTFGSLSQVLRRITYPIESFGFDYIQRELAPPLLEGHYDKMGKQPRLFE